MNKRKLKIISLFVFFILLSSGLSYGNSYEQKIITFEKDDDFYFVQITDTHVMHKIFDRNEISKNRFKRILSYICSFEKKPDFIVITGDLTEWGGSRISGALNCRAFTSCLYKMDDKFYADENFSVPIYTTPGNHDYYFNRNLSNYYKYINNKNHYVINHKNISFFFMNSGPSYYREIYNWFVNVDSDGLYDYDIQWLDDALNNCTNIYKIILMHHPAVNLRNDKGKMRDVIKNNREVFINLCDEYNVELVLTGHTHYSRVFDSKEFFYEFNDSLNCSLYPTLYVQTDDCKEGIHYRNVSFVGNSIFLENCVELDV